MTIPIETPKVYAEVIDFIAAGTSPDGVIAFQPSESAKTRVADLIYREKTTGLSIDFKSESDHYMQLEHLMRLAKARARQFVKMSSYVSEELRRKVALRG